MMSKNQDKIFRIKDYFINDLDEQNQDHFRQIQENLEEMNRIDSKPVLGLWWFDEAHVDKGIMEVEALIRHNNDQITVCDFWNPIKDGPEVGFIAKDGSGSLHHSKEDLIHFMLPIYEKDLTNPEFKFTPKAKDKMQRIINMLKEEKEKLDSKLNEP